MGEYTGEYDGAQESSDAESSGVEAVGGWLGLRVKREEVFRNRLILIMIRRRLCRMVTRRFTIISERLTKYREGERENREDIKLR